MKVLITGGSGYFGELLTSYLLKEGYDCRILDLNKPSPEIAGQVEFISGDIRDQEVALRACNGIEAIFHNVAQVPLAKNKQLFNSVNYDGTRNVLKFGFKMGVSKFIYTSSSAVFGVPNNNPVTEETIPCPGEAYGQAKLDGEKLSLSYAKEGMQVSVLRPRTILGHGRLGIFQILFEWIYRGYNVPVFDQGNNIYQFVHAEDLAYACVLAVKGKGGIYNIGAEKYGTMRETLQNLADYANTGTNVRSLPSKLVLPFMKAASAFKISPLGAYHALMYGKSMYFDTTKAKEELGWQAKYDTEKMMRESYDWYLENRDSVLGGSTLNSSHHKSAVKQGVLALIGRLL